jgi:YVTN family beta-propeller protein
MMRTRIVRVLGAVTAGAALYSLALAGAASAVRAAPAAGAVTGLRDAAATARTIPPAVGARHETAYVVNAGSGTVTPISVATGKAGCPIRVGDDPEAIAITPDGKTAYVLDAGSGSVTPIRTATNTAGTSIAVGTDPVAIAITR